MHLLGAAGAYLADKYTDKRRNSEAIKAGEELWKNVCNKFPSLIKVMQEDFRSPENHSVRKFFVTRSSHMISPAEYSFAYYTDVHPDISAAMLYLQDIGYIQDITSGSCPMYRMYEHFADRLKNA